MHSRALVLQESGWFSRPPACSDEEKKTGKQQVMVHHVGPRENSGT